MRNQVWVTWIAAVVALVATSGPLRASDLDDRIEASARNSYVFRTYIEGDAIRVTSENGVVTLTGTALDDFQRSLAQETVANLPGVKRIDNRIELKEKDLAGKPDEWIAAKVRTALLFRRSVDARAIDISVRDGIVILRGDAVSQSHKDVTTEYARTVDGVQDVQNEMTVSETAANRYEATMRERIDDASITAQVRLALLFHRSARVLGTEVETREGVVRLRGAARSEAEKDLVGVLVGDIKGVKAVKNEMSVAEAK